MDSFLCLCVRPVSLRAFLLGGAGESGRKREEGRKGGREGG